MFITKTAVVTQDTLRKKITAAYRQDERQCVNDLLLENAISEMQWQQIETLAQGLILKMRSQKPSPIDSFMSQYDLSNEEGISLMCLAEALLRIPDGATVDKLIKDKITKANWKAHAGKSTSLLVNTATVGLMLTSKILNVFGTRQAIRQAMKFIGRQFVLGETIETALKRSQRGKNAIYRYSFDMLGEAARTDSDAKCYFAAYKHAIHTIGAQNMTFRHSVSVKLSALHPRYEANQFNRVTKELTPKLHELALLAKQYNVGLTVDAEEADKLDLSLDIFAQVFANEEFTNWDGLGLAVQAYQKRAPFVIAWLQALSESYQRKIMLRLVKGAYWDSEIKQSQILGLSGYPVYTRKQTTDVAYIICAKKILQAPHAFYPQFATHNAVTIATIMTLAGQRRDFEFQRLYGMGESLYASVLEKYSNTVVCRVYAPVGIYQNLLAYLVRRLLENGANTSFVNQLNTASSSMAELVNNPMEQLKSKKNKAHPAIVLPKNIYAEARENSPGIDWSNRQTCLDLQQSLEKFMHHQNGGWNAGALINGVIITVGDKIAVTNPAHCEQKIGEICFANQEIALQAIDIAKHGFKLWSELSVERRAKCLEDMAQTLIDNQTELFALLALEAGKTLPNALNELREAIDFCRYYAKDACIKFAQHKILDGPTGETNILSYKGRGVFICISPWNFPLAIFLGQIMAALVTGNTVIAKPAEQTSLLAFRLTQLAHQAGIPADVFQLLPGTGEVIGSCLVANQDIAGVMFTGSTQTARLINQTLAQRHAPIIPFIAETGGQNVMIVDSSALLEQVSLDIVYSAFDSAGQRCSALRVLYVQEDIADSLLIMLQGAMQELTIGNPCWLETDVGPVIDAQALQLLVTHCENIKGQSKFFFQCNLLEACSSGTFFPPTLIEIDDINILTQEVFGPVLHMIRYQADKLPSIIDKINQTGYGLTFGIHSRIEDTIKDVCPKINAGNIYINRNMVGAVVGVQPFGGRGLSGTGPKAGGPNYLMRLVEEQSVSINTTALGGNASLLLLDDELD